MGKSKIRKLIQILSTILCNLNIKGLFEGSLFKGKIKGVCVPGLNCNSCPLSVGTCPLGALQATLGNMKKGINLYVVGMITMFSVLFGRAVCGFLCPFGLLQEIIYLLPTKKIRREFKILSYGKYVVLAIFVILLPIVLMISKGMGIPAFCKYICPQGTIAGILLSINSEKIRSMIGNTFYIKLFILVTIIVISIFIFRPFCRFICPLGAIYGLFNSIAFVQISLNADKCTNCGMCSNACPMNLDVVHNCNSADCIRCGKCMDSCSNHALNYQCGALNTKQHTNSTRQ